MIWTTTPWTIPANQALNAHPDFDVRAGATPRGLLVLAADLVGSVASRATGSTARCSRRRRGAALERIAFHHPFYDRAAPVYLGDYVTLEHGTGIVHTSPAYGVEDFRRAAATA